MTSSSEGNIPSFRADVVNSLPLYYRAMAEYLAETGRVIIKDSEKEHQNSA